jgi:succinoglycan biosynthesis protein ExoO
VSNALLPLISVIVPCYNAERFVGRAISSALGQTGVNVEVIVIDDASTDGTASLVESLAANDPRVRLIQCDVNGGPGRARNRGLAAAKGEWVAILDADDWYAPQRLQTLTALAEEDGASLVADNQYFVPSHSERPWQILRDPNADPVIRISCNDLFLGDKLTQMRNLGLLKMIARRKFIDESGLRYDEEKGIAEDFYFLLKCLLSESHLLFVSQPYYYYRTHGKSLTNTLSSDQVLALRTFHDRCWDQFQDHMEGSTRRLMLARGQAIESYIRYKLVVAAIENGDIKTSILRVLADPPIFLLLTRAFVFRIIRSLAATLPRRVGMS